MGEWSPQYPINFTPSGDTTSQAIEKHIKEIEHIYDLLNRVRKLDAGDSAPTDPIVGHVYLDTSTGQAYIKYYDGAEWKKISFFENVYYLSSFSKLSDAITQIGSQNAVLVIDESFTVSEDVTIPENVTLFFLPGAILTIDTKTKTTETIATGDGSTTSFSYTVNDPPIKKKSITISYTISGTAYTATDDGYGNISGTDCSGTVNYLTGDVSLTFSTAPDNGTDITIDYTPTYLLTINGNIKAGLWQIFDGDGWVTGNPKIEAIYPQWFGAKGDGSDDGSALQKAFDLATEQNQVVLTKLFHTTQTLYIKRYFTIKGLGRTTGIKNDATDGSHCLILEYTSDDGVIREVCISDISILGNSSSGIGVYIKNPARIVFERVRVANHGGKGIYCERTGGYNFLISFYDCWFSNNGDWGVDIDNGNAVNFYNCSWQGNVGELRFDGQYINVFGGYIGGTKATSGGAVEIAGASGSPGQSVGGLYGVGFENNGSADAHIFIGSINTVRSFEIKGCYFNNPGGKSGDVSCIKINYFKQLTIENCYFYKSGTYSGTVKGIEIVSGSGYANNGLFIKHIDYVEVDTDISNPNGIKYISVDFNDFKGVRFYNEIITFTNGDTTPSVAGSNIFKEANTSATSITTFDNGVAGQKITVIFTSDDGTGNSNTTIVHGSGIYLKSGANVTPKTNTTMSFVYDGTNWYEV